MAKQRPVQHFPNTWYTMIGRLMNDPDWRRGRLAVGTYVMEVYREPLRAYYLGSSFRSLGPVDDVLQGFFADRLHDETFFDRWIASGRQLRFWLMTAFRHYAFEQIAANQKQRKRFICCDRIEHGSDDEAQHAFHRESALQLVRQAITAAQATCAEKNLTSAWHAFTRRMIDGRSYRELSEEMGIAESQFHHMIRQARNRFVDVMRELVAWPGATDNQIDEEIRELMELMRR